MMNFRVYVTLYCAIYVLTAVAKEIEIIEKRGVLPRCATPLVPVDVLLLLDSSSSVTAWEFSQFLSLLMGLSSALPVGPVQVGLVSISDFPVLEFRIGQHQTATALQGSLGVLRQRGGDTNSGLALEWALRQGFTPGWGSRAGAHRVLLWITDGMSTDEVELPARLLKEAGVRVLLVSTGRSDHGIRTVVSDHSSMFFTDTDNLPEISAQLCEAIVASSANVREKGNNPNTLTDKKPAVSSKLRILTPENLRENIKQVNTLTYKNTTDFSKLLNLKENANQVNALTEKKPAASASVRERGNNPDTLTDKKPAALSLSSNLSAVREERNNVRTGNNPNTLTDKKPAERLSSLQHLMLTDVTSSSLVASWAELEEQEVRQYKVRRIDSSGRIQEHSLPGHVRTVYLRDLAPRSTHVICVSALYKHGRSAETCAKKRTLPAPVNKRRHIPYRLCSPYFRCKC
ncbi:von Willebrand factor A domain-containing protein 1-like isoform X3 [Polyodon spathula]|uniref:von Willebrand factor A domain-containing protein 1-like isoform X3 n=1 Tax=Polyodon spathula TaxID=7913 RepID=UPI001B7E0361|nr:von Willebrand factor A domain-containing protein 1-like isoform X3 [Polyodon spathula]